LLDNRNKNAVAQAKKDLYNAKEYITELGYQLCWPDFHLVNAKIHYYINKKYDGDIE